MKSHVAAKQAALQKLMDLMDEHGADELRGLKGKPVAEVASITAAPKDEEEADEPTAFKKAWNEMKGIPNNEEPEVGAGDDEEGLGGDEDELSDEDKQRISDLYHKHVARG